MNLVDKLSRLKEILRQMHSMVVAFSGGVDSTLLADVAREVLPGKILLVTAVSETYTPAELAQAKELAGLFALPHEMISTSELSNENFVNNPPERCYYCKRELFAKLIEIAKKKGYQYVVDGANVDDGSDFRPGMKAGGEMGIRSPLKEAGLTKKDIRALSQQRNLPTWDQPSCACLASRFPYGVRITKENLQRIARIEEYLAGLGFRGSRARFHGETVRIEVSQLQMPDLLEKRHEIVELCKTLGFIYITLDLEGYRTGSMNEALDLS